MDKEAEIRKTAFAIENNKLAKEFSTPGTLQHFIIRQGFLPYDEAGAETLMKSIIDSEYRLQQRVEELENKIKYMNVKEEN